MSGGHGDNFGPSFETRVALVEDGQRRLERRLEEWMTEAHAQRAFLIRNAEEVKTMVHQQKNDLMKTVIELGHHVEECSRRSGRLEKFQLALMSGIMAIIAGLVVNYLK